MIKRYVMKVNGGGARGLRLTLWGVCMACLVIAGCSTRKVTQPAPVEDRSSARPVESKSLQGSESVAKPGFYAVRPGDTLYRIALEAGQSPRDVQAWNNLSNPNLIEIGQVLRVAPPVSGVGASGASGSAGVTSAAVAPPGVVARPLSPPAAVTPASGAVPSTPSVPQPVAGNDDIGFVWPAQGAVLSAFDESKNKGVAISGKLGDPVLAAADGRVVYAGAGLRGYGNLIILKHNATFLTAYAHNQALLVREDQTVKQGQRIAEMGSSDADRVKLHFEVRRLGKPVDPLNFLPKR